VLGIEISKSTYDSMYRKLKMRRIRWLDAGDTTRRKDEDHEALWGETSPAARRIQDFNAKTDLKPGRVLVIRQPAEGREYGLFLSYLLRRLVHALSMRDIAFPVLVVVDEAHEIFCGEKAVADAATISVQRAVLKGRSLGLGFVFSSQNPSQVPSTILNNLNTRIVHRLNSADELKLALPDASDELGSVRPWSPFKAAGPRCAPSWPRARSSSPG
jgi:DNA helicase HerA-like ATPase